MLQRLYDNLMKTMLVFSKHSNMLSLALPPAAQGCPFATRNVEQPKQRSNRFFQPASKATLLEKVTYPMPRKLKLLALSALTIVLTTVISGCGITSLKQRETQLSQQQQQLEEQRQQLDSEQQELQQELARLNTLKAALDQEQKRLDAFKKSPNSRYSVNNNNASTQTSLVRLGALEQAYLSPPGIHLTARIDTGAETSSLNALDLTEFERDGKPYVRFNIIDPVNAEKIQIIRRVNGRVKIKEHQGEAQSRLIVKMRVRIGNLDQRIKMTLTDRSEFKNQVLIGRNFLRDFAVVDVSKQFLFEANPSNLTEAD